VKIDNSDFSDLLEAWGTNYARRCSPLIKTPLATAGFLFSRVEKAGRITEPTQIEYLTVCDGNDFCAEQGLRGLDGGFQVCPHLGIGGTTIGCTSSLLPKNFRSAYRSASL
jgi:hypothetical protein